MIYETPRLVVRPWTEDDTGRLFDTEAARGALDRAWAAGVGEVFAVVRPGNDASTAVCRRLGMEHLGRTTKGYGIEAETFRIVSPGRATSTGPS